MAAEAQVRAVITAEDRASAVVAGFGTSFGKMTAAVTTGIAIFDTLKNATAGIVDIFTSSITAFEEQENATVRLQGAIKNVTSAQDKNINGLLKQASALEKVTRFSDEQIISAQGILATYQLNQKQIETLTPHLIDMAEGMANVSGEMPDLNENAKLVAKALGGEDTDSLVGVLRRANIMLTNHQMELLKTGTFQERLAVLTQTLDMNVGGLGETMGNTASGKMLQFNHAINNLQEQLGGALYTALAPFIAKLTEWASSDRARQVMQEIADKIVQFGKVAYAFIKDNWPTIKNTFETFGRIAWDIARAIDAVTTAIGKIPKPPSWLTDAAKSGSKNALSALTGGLFRAAGGPVMAGSPYVVGEAGPELFVPGRSGTIIPNGAVGGQTVNLSVNVGTFVGSEMEKRKLAESLFKAYNDLQSSRGMA